MLTVKQINSAKPRDRTYKRLDGGGLYLQVTPAGGRRWRFKYRNSGREKLLSVGLYPTLKRILEKFRSRLLAG
jgi:hypothetical protein